MISLKYLVLVICLFMLLESDVDGNKLRRANLRDKKTKKPHPTKGSSAEGSSEEVTTQRPTTTTTTIPTTTTTTTPFPVYSLAQNIPLASFIDNGYELVYDQPYSHVSTSDEIDAIAAICSATSILCAGGKEAAGSDLILVSCGACLDVTAFTALNTPVLHNGAYWYKTPSKSFGFAPNNQIVQGQADAIDWNDAVKSDFRLSWHLDLAVGGWRLGSIIKLNYDSAYNKVILVKL